GYSHAADTLAARTPNRRSLAREMSLVSACRQVVFDGSDEALGSLFDLASDSRTTPAFRQVSIAALYYAYLARRDTGRAKAAADALWAESESARAHLEAMGVRPLAREA